MQRPAIPAYASGPFPPWPFPAGEVHVWAVVADDHLCDVDSLYALLSSNERVRASRIRRDRDRWVVARSLLRCVLGGCLGRDPDAIEFRPGRNDKPELAPDDSRPVPRFNLSHSGRMVLIAVAGAPVGVDVERVRDTLDVTGLSRHVLRSAEIEALNGIPAPRRPEAFIAAWTRKEAYLKARALGIGGVQSVTVSVDPDDPAELLGADGDPDGVAGWTLVDLPVDPGYRAALAVLGRATVVRRTLGRMDGPGGG